MYITRREGGIEGGRKGGGREGERKGEERVVGTKFLAEIRKQWQQKQGLRPPSLPPSLPPSFPASSTSKSFNFQKINFRI
jgi:hypothetical protein